MATYSELYDLAFYPDLLHRAIVAVVLLAEEVRTEDPATANHAERLALAKRALANPDGIARQLLWIMLAQNKDFTVEQIQAASDTNIQSAVNAAAALLL